MKRITAGYFNKLAKGEAVFYEFSEEERKALQKCLFDIYLDIAKVCKKYNLCIMMSGGSALGAVRHQGFIPWDDDLDVMLPREDYNKLIEVFDAELGERYELSAPETMQECNEPFMEIIKKDTLMRRVYNNKKSRNGIRIDILPIEKVPSNKFARRMNAFLVDGMRIIIGCKNTFSIKDLFYKKCLTTTLKMKLYYYARYTIGMMFFPVSRRYLCVLLNKITSCVKDDTYWGLALGRKYYLGEIFPKNVFFPPKTALFEGEEVYIPNDVNAYLQNLYGDYMQIPPIEKREEHFLVDFSFDTAKDKKE